MLTAPLLPGVTGAMQLDWTAMMALRQRVLAHTDVPRYLLLPEIDVLLQLEDNDHRRMLIELLWMTGARVNEALALTLRDIVLDDPHQPYVSLKTLKLREKGPGRPSKDSPKPRLVPLLDAGFVVRLRRYLASHKFYQTKPIWRVTDQTVRNWLSQAYDRCAEAGCAPAFRPGPHTMRHSYATHLVLHRVPLPVLQAWMGHRSRASTEVYTRILGVEAFGLGQQIPFSMALPDHSIDRAQAPPAWAGLLHGDGEPTSR